MDPPLQGEGDRRERKEDAVFSGEFYLSLVGKTIVAGQYIANFALPKIVCLASLGFLQNLHYRTHHIEPTRILLAVTCEDSPQTVKQKDIA